MKTLKIVQEIIDELIRDVVVYEFVKANLK